MNTIEDLLNVGGNISLPWDSSVVAGDLVVGNADGKVYPIRALGKKRIATSNVDTTAGRVDRAQLTGGRIVEVYGNASGNPTFTLYDAGMKEAVPETVISTSTHTSYGIRVTALSNGDFFIFWLNYYAYPCYAVYASTGVPVKAFTQIEAVNWWYNGGNVVPARKPIQLSGGNVVIVGVNNVGSYVRYCELNAAGTVLYGPSDSADVASGWLDDPVASPSDNRWAYNWITAAGLWYARVMTTGLLGVTANGGDASVVDTCHDFDSAGNYWCAWLSTGASPVTYVLNYSQGGVWALNSFFNISTSAVNLYNHMRGKCTGDNKFVFAVTAQNAGGGPATAYGVAELSQGAVIQNTYLTYVPMPFGDLYVAAAASSYLPSGRDSISIASTATGDVVVFSSYYAGNWNRLAEELYVHALRIGRDGSLVKSKRFEFGASAGGSSIYRHALFASKSHLIVGLQGQYIARAYLMPGAPVIGAASSAGKVSQSGKYTGGGGLPTGQTLAEVYSLFDHIVDAAFLSSTEFVLGGA